MCIIYVYYAECVSIGAAFWGECCRFGIEVKMKKRVNITLEDEVIQRIDHFADEHYTSRSGAITMLIVEATGSQKNAQTQKDRAETRKV